MGTTLKLSLLMVFALVLIGAVSATATFNTPSSGSMIRGATYTLNVTATITKLNNCSVTASSAATGDSLATTWLYNKTGYATYANATIDSTALEDANDWVFTGYCYNITGQSEAITSVTATVDNTVPQTPTSISPTTATDKKDIEFSATVVGVNTTGCTLTFDTAVLSSSYSMTHSGNTCTYTKTLPSAGYYYYTITSTDGSNTSLASERTTLLVEESGGHVTGGSSRSTTTTTTSSGSNNTGLFVVVVIGVLLITSMNGKKKK